MRRGWLVGWSSPKCSVVPLARLCHLRRVAEACERVTDLFWRRLEGCGGHETYEVEFLHPEA